MRHPHLLTVAAGITLTTLIVGCAATIDQEPAPTTPVTVVTPKKADKQIRHLITTVTDSASRYAADKAALPHHINDLTGYGVTPGTGDHASFKTTDGYGFCVSVWNTLSKEHSKKNTAMRYDSVTQKTLKPGHKPADGACANS